MIEERQSSIQKSYDLLNVLSRERLEILQVIINVVYEGWLIALRICFRTRWNCLTSTLSVTTSTSGSRINKRRFLLRKMSQRQPRLSRTSLRTSPSIREGWSKLTMQPPSWSWSFQNWSRRFQPEQRRHTATMMVLSDCKSKWKRNWKDPPVSSTSRNPVRLIWLLCVYVPLVLIL